MALGTCIRSKCLLTKGCATRSYYWRDAGGRPKFQHKEGAI